MGPQSPATSRPFLPPRPSLTPLSVVVPRGFLYFFADPHYGIGGGGAWNILPHPSLFASLFPIFQVLAEVSLPWGHLSDVLTRQRLSYACP